MHVMMSGMCSYMQPLLRYASKLTIFSKSVFLFDAFVRKESLHLAARNFVTKNYRVLVATHSEDFVISARQPYELGKHEYRWADRATGCDGQTDRHAHTHGPTDACTIGKWRLAVTRKNEPAQTRNIDRTDSV